MSGNIIKVSRNTENAPLSSNSSQSVAFSHYNNISAQLAIDPKTGELVSGSAREQAVQCLENIKAIVESVGHTLSDLVRVNVYLKNISDLNMIDEVYGAYFSCHLPTRTVLAVAELPISGAVVQMDAVLSNGEGTPPQAPCALVKVARNTLRAPVSPLATQSVAFSHYNHISAQLPIDPQTGNVVVGGVHEQACQCLKNIKSILEGVDVPFDDVVKVNIHLRDLRDLEQVNRAYSRFFPDSGIARTLGYLPARSVVVTQGLPMDALVQMDATVSHGDGTPPQEVEDRHGIVIRPNNTKEAPICPFSTQTVAFSHYNNISAQLPIDTTSGEIISGCVTEQTQQCMSNIKQIVESVGHTMDDMVKINIQLRDIDDLDAVSRACDSYFSAELPARTVIGVADIAQGALVQIDAIISNGEGTLPQ